MMVAIECWLVHTKTVVKRMAGSMTPSAKNTVARMITKLRSERAQRRWRPRPAYRQHAGGGCVIAGGDVALSQA